MTSTPVKAKDLRQRRRKLPQGTLELLLMAMPAILLVFVFSYLPMYGIVLAFKNFIPSKGILGSDWVGFQNFEFFFKSLDAWRITRNTIGLNVLFITSGLIICVGFALLLFEIRQRTTVKIFQTAMMLPNFLSWVVVGYMTYAFLNPSLGILNRVLLSMGLEKVEWYLRAEYWPWILLIVSIWKGAGAGSVIYYAALMGIDPEYFEAARIDGASGFQVATRITLPFLVPYMTIMTILAIGGIFRSDFGMFYNLTRNVGALYRTTDVIDTYVYRALREMGEIGMSSAVGLFQSVVGFVLVLVTNFVVNRIDSDNALM